MFFVSLFVYILITLVSINLVKPKNKTQLWLASTLIPLITLGLYALIFAEGSYYYAGVAIAQCLLPALISGVVIYTQLKKELIKRSKNENLETERNKINKTSRINRIITNPVVKKTIKETVIGLILFVFFTFCWLYLLSFIRETSIADIFNTTYYRGEYKYDYRHTSEGVIFRAVFIVGEIFLIFFSKKMTTKLIDLIEFIKKLK